jgi:pyruvate dehydrogenase E1 component alpha subunit/2-oxoisovalerate dehydrogenase E1 component alpha subunit
MVQTTEAPAPRVEPTDLKNSCLKAYRWMLLARVAEDKIANLYRGGKITGGVFLGKGQEALSASLGVALQDGDIFAPLIRDQAGRFAFGEQLIDYTRTYIGSRLGPMRGRDGNIHRGRPRAGQLAMISHLGAMIPVVAGGLMARRFQGLSGAVGATCIGEGGTSTGAFHEGLNLAAVEKLPLVVVVANNQYSYSTPNTRQFACHDLASKAIGYGIDGHTVDGTDLAACLSVVGSAVARARAGHGPQLVVATLLRLVGHGEHDDAGYVDPKLKQSAAGRDCLKVAEQLFLTEGWCDTRTLRQWLTEAQKQVDEAVAMTMREPLPDPNEEDWCALANRHLTDGFTGE